MPNTTKLAILGALTGLGLAFSAWADAATNPSADRDAASVKIYVADLKTGDESSARALLQRIRRAAISVCGDELNRPECIRDTVERAVVALDNQAVSALNSARGQPAPVLVARGR